VSNRVQIACRVGRGYLLYNYRHCLSEPAKLQQKSSWGWTGWSLDKICFLKLMCLLYNLKAPLYVILKFPYVGLKSSTTGLHAPKVKKTV